MIDPDSLKRLAADKIKENKRFFQFLKKHKPKDLDVVIAELNDEVFENIDCLDCANCCKSISPVLIDHDIQRIASHLRMKPSAFVEQYLYIDEDGDYVYKEAPCPFLMSDNYCMIYDKRPRACREYPHTNRKRFVQILDLTLKNTFVCPAVYEIIEALKKKY